jgi:predicted transposase/invertase (TIGR01784 family)
MSLTEFDQEEYDRILRRDAYLDGRDDGRNEGLFMGKQESARNMLADGLPVEKVAQYTGLSVEDIQALETEQVTV